MRRPRARVKYGVNIILAARTRDGINLLAYDTHWLVPGTELHEHGRHRLIYRTVASQPQNAFMGVKEQL